ncbi:MAG TPA: translocation/assembly module TamB domain-containing protein [Candidatus Solibacter sp.]|nr:translocation/assembly module TamB domain-containing protein [Candidatus Solibacter sp.]
MKLAVFRWLRGRSSGRDPSPDKRPAPVKAPRSKRFRRIRATIGIVLLSLVVGLVLFLNSNAFQEKVRKRIIAELELMTGGKVEIQSFTWSLSRLQFEITGLTIHGLERPEQAPYVHADRVFVRATVTSWFSQQIGLRYIAVDRPVVHFIVYPDGSTNQPTPKIRQVGNRSPIDHLFELAVTRIEVTNGELIWNQKKFPFDFTGENLSAAMSYSAADKTYDGKLAVELLSAHELNVLPLRGKINLHYLLRSTQTQIQTFQLATERSHLEGSGTITNYWNPEILFRYTASVDLPELAQGAKIPELRAGRLNVNGMAAYLNQRYSSEGVVSVQGAGWNDAPVHLSGMNLTSLFFLTPEKISFTHLVAHLLGGNAQGEIQVANWNSYDAAHKSAPQRGTANLKITGVQIGQLATAISTPRLRVDQINLTGSTSGEVTASWVGSPRNAVAEVKLESTAPSNPLPRQVPVTAQLQATYRGPTQTLEVAGLSLATRALRLNATGTLGATSTQLNVAFNANDLNELQPVLAALSPRRVIPASVSGRVSFNGSIFGRLSQPSARGHLDVQNFETVLGASASRKGTGSIHWDSFIADLVYTPASLGVQNGLLRRGAARVGFSGGVTLFKGQFDQKNSQVTADLRLQNANVEELKSLAGFAYPVTGVMNANLHVAGTLQNLRGGGSLLLTKLTLYGEPFRQLRADLSFAGGETQFNNILLSHNGTQLTGSAGYTLTSRQLLFDLKGADIELANFRRFQPQRITMEGRVDFHATGSGTLDAPLINAQLTFRNLVLNGERVGDVTAVAETHGADMVVHAHSNFEKASLNLDGSVHLRENFPGQVTIKFDHLDFDPLIRAYSQARITGHSTMQGAIELRGPMKLPRDLTITANLDQLSAEVENVRVRNVGPIRFSVANQVARIDQLHLAGDETAVSLHGTAQLVGAGLLDLHADGNLNLKLLQTFNPGMVSSGTTVLALDVAGTISQPQVRGRLDITDGGISFTDLPNGLSHINGRLVFARDRMQIETLTAHTGGGELNVSGFIAYRNGVYCDLTASGRDIRLRYPPGVSASAHADLRYTGSARSSQLSGDVTIIRFSVNPRFDFAQYLALSKAPTRTSIRNPFLDNMRLDVHIVSTPELRVETSLAKLSGDVNLRLRGTVSNPVVLGRVNIVEGDIFFNSTKYRLERGDISFSNPLVIQPIVDVEMGARVRGYDITIGFHGPVDHLSVTYRSDPPLPSGDIVALLAFGRTRQDELYNSQSNQGLSTAANTFLGQAMSSASTSRVQKLFGVSRVKIDPQVGGPENNPSPRVTIEQQLNNNITVTYVTNIAQSSSQQLIQVEYNVTRNISIVAVRDQNGILSFDVHYRQRKR